VEIERRDKMAKKTAGKRKSKNSGTGPKPDAVARFREKHGGDSVNDDVTARLKRFVTDDGHVDLDRLKKLGEANSVWNPAWENLSNKGLLRMSLGNRLRKLERDGTGIKWGRGSRK
jgi:hypothetical protein